MPSPRTSAWDTPDSPTPRRFRPLRGRSGDRLELRRNVPTSGTSRTSSLASAFGEHACSARSITVTAGTSSAGRGDRSPVTTITSSGAVIGSSSDDAEITRTARATHPSTAPRAPAILDA